MKMRIFVFLLLLGLTFGFVFEKNSVSGNIQSNLIFNEFYTPSGVYNLVPTIQYTCVFGLVNLNYDQFTFVDDSDTLIVQPAMDGGSFMSGPSATNGVIDVSCVYPGSCNEYFTLEGDFIDNDTWQATFTITFIGSCFDCTAQQWSITGTNVVTSEFPINYLLIGVLIVIPVILLWKKKK